MKVVARYLRVVRKAPTWWREEQQAWLDEGLVPADCVSELPTRENSLSVYELTHGGPSAERIAAALALRKAIGGASHGQSLKEAVCITFESSILDQVAIEVSSAKPGKTGDTLVDDVHRDLVNISGHKLADLALTLLRESLPETYYAEALLEVIRETHADRLTTLPPKVGEQLSKLDDAP